MRRLFASLLGMAVLLVGGLAQAKIKKEVRRHLATFSTVAPTPISLELPLPSKPLEVGLVSWYGPGFHGRRTASGERYDMHGMTCASRHLPFGTMLELTNLENGEKAIVRVNDRGPFLKRRILDLSLAAAKKLGFHRRGQTRVEVREISVDRVASSN